MGCLLFLIFLFLPLIFIVLLISNIWSFLVSLIIFLVVCAYIDKHNKEIKK